MATINRRVLTTLAVLSLFSLCVYGSDTPSIFEFYQTLSTDNSNQVDIFQQSSILYVNNTGYAFTFGFKVYATDLVPFLNASQTEPPANNIYSNFTQAFTLNAPTSESFASASFYTSGFNSSNSGCYVTGTYYIFQYDAVTFAAKRSMPTPQSAGLENTFIDGKNMYASLRAQNLIYVFDLESFTLNTTKNFTMPFVTKATLYDTSSRLGYFFSADGEVQVWNASSLTIYDNFNLTVGYGADYQLTSVFLDEVRQILYVGMNNGTNGPPILQMFNLQPTSNTTKRQVADSNPTLIRQIVLSETPLTWTSIYVDTIGGQAFTGLTDGNNGQFLRVDLSTHTVAETVYVATADNGRVALSYHLGIQNQSLVLYSESAVNVYQYPTTCPNDCTSSEQGWCNFGTCNCSTGWTSSDCSQIACTTDCNAASGHGQCNNGVCLCGDDWTGSNCETRRCPKDCSGTNGACQGPSTNYTCTCNFRFSGAGCEVPRVLSCPEIPGAQECTGRGGECGWCESEKRCLYGNNIGPVHGACPDWFTENPKDVGIMAFAIIYVIICSILVLINIISALVIDHRNATELVATKRLTATTIRKNWWRDERSNMGWLLFEQLQFISLYGLVTVGYSTRILSFTRYFDWTCLVIPLPNYSDLEYHPERSTARNTLSYEQYGNGNDSGIQQIWYAQMVWLGIAAAGFTIIHIIYSIIATVMRGGASKEVFFSRLIHMWMRGLNIFYFPLVLLAATHTRYGYKSIAGSIIVLIVVGLGVPAISFGVTYGKRKQLFKYEWRAKFGSFYSTYHFNLPYYQAGVFAKKAAIGLLVGFMASPLSQPRLAFGQVFGAIGVMILFIAALIVFRPYLDKTHLLLEIGLNVVNIISIGMALTNYSGPSLIGDIVFLLLQIIGLLIVLGAFIHCWLAMESVNCCGGKKDQDNENNTSELATMKM